jgi:aminopeptidase-like protein
LVAHARRTGALPLEIRPFTPTDGSDERQYCSPGFNLPVGQLARTVYGEYPGYHNSLDTKEFMGIEPLIASADAIERLIEMLEYAGTFQNLRPYGEPQLGKRGLYPNTNSPQAWTRSHDGLMDNRELLNAILTILNYSDGTRPMIEIADRLGAPLHRLIPIVDRLEQEGLLVPAFG